LLPTVLFTFWWNGNELSISIFRSPPLLRSVHHYTDQQTAQLSISIFRSPPLLRGVASSLNVSIIAFNLHFQESALASQGDINENLGNYQTFNLHFQESALASVAIVGVVVYQGTTFQSPFSGVRPCFAVLHLRILRLLMGSFNLHFQESALAS